MNKEEYEHLSAAVAIAFMALVAEFDQNVIRYLHSMNDTKRAELKQHVEAANLWLNDNKPEQENASDNQ